MANTPNGTDSKKAALNGLAVVGFGALIIAGIFLAIYAARYVPETLSRLSSAVILSSEPEENEETPTTPAETPTTPSTPSDTPAKPTPTTSQPPVMVSNPPYVVQTTPNLYGRPDLALVNVEAGYMRGTTFVEDNDVPDNRDAAVRFTVRNTGTNIASGWRVRVDAEDEGTATAFGGVLYPNGTQNFALIITDPEEGEILEIEIDVDYQDNVSESNERNNDETVDLDIED